MDLISEATGGYILQPGLLDKHKDTLNWLSATTLWRGEISFFQKMMDGTAQFFNSPEDKKMVHYFQELFIQYSTDEIWNLREKLLAHEGLLAEIIVKQNTKESEYYQEHERIISELGQFAEKYTELKHNFFKFIKKLK